MAAAPTTREALRSSQASTARMAARLTSPFRPRSPKPSRSILAQPEGSRIPRQSPGGWPGTKPRRRVFPYLAGRLRLSRLQAEIETYVNPWAADDPGQPQVTSRIGDGFNLDGKIKPTDFVSPDGEKGIDNNLYRAWGCDAPWRGNGNATLDLRANDKMQEGLYTMVIRVSGNKDPMNDNDATVEIGYSPDKIVKDARGSVGCDYSYRILKSAQYTKLKAKIKDGVVETEQVEHLTPRASPGSMTRPGHQFPPGQDPADHDVRRLRQRAWWAATATGASSTPRTPSPRIGGQQGIREHEDHVALYYALRRNADGMFNAKTGNYDGISSVYRIKMASAYVVDPDKPMDIPVRRERDGAQEAFDDTSQGQCHQGRRHPHPAGVPPGSTRTDSGRRRGN